MKLRIELENDWYIHWSIEYRREYSRRYKGLNPLMPGEYNPPRKYNFKEQLIRDGYIWRSKEYISEYNRRVNWRQPLTYADKLAWIKAERKKTNKVSKRTPEYWEEYRKNYRLWIKLKDKKPRYTKQSLYQKIALMRKEQWIIL